MSSRFSFFLSLPLGSNLPYTSSKLFRATLSFLCPSRSLFHELQACRKRTSDPGFLLRRSDLPLKAFASSSFFASRVDGKQLQERTGIAGNRDKKSKREEDHRVTRFSTGRGGSAGEKPVATRPRCGTRLVRFPRWVLLAPPGGSPGDSRCPVSPGRSI